MNTSEHSTANSEVPNPCLNNQVDDKVKLKRKTASEAPEVAKLMQELNPPKEEREVKKFQNFRYWHSKRRAEEEKESRLFNNVRR